MRNNLFYIPKLQELENGNHANNSTGQYGNGNSNNNNSNIITNTNILTTPQNNYYSECNATGNTGCITNINLYEECCGGYVLNFPQSIGNLNARDVGFEQDKTKIINNSSLKIDTPNGCILYSIFFTGGTLLTKQNITLQIPSDECSIPLKISGTIKYSSTNYYWPGKQIPVIINTLPGTEDSITSLVFDSMLTLFPYKTHNGLDKQKMLYIPSVDNRGLLFLKYSYSFKTFNINLIAITLASDAPLSLYR